MRFRKQYGLSMSPLCQFCSVVATTRNGQRVPVCRKHVSEKLDVKCACGSWLDVRDGKYGIYFTCINCGNVPFSKGMG